MKHAAIKRGTSSADLDKQSIGYAGSGESQYTRRAAHGGRAPIAELPETLTQPQFLLRRHLGELRKLERKISVETDPARAAKLVRQQEIKMRFIERLRAEQRRQVS
jgi:hypothetical protein